MVCLGIESSCDETALALVRDGKLVQALMSSQADLHALFGGVVPELASREHARLLERLYDALLEKSGFSQADIDCIAFARGPGLLGSLLVGAAFAKSLALGLGKPLIGINHLHAHLLAAGLEQELAFPALGLLVSGGHTHIYRVDSPRAFSLLGKTLDDAAGEAFDKVGKMLGLPYPAGRLIDEHGARGTVRPGMFRCPYVNNDNLDFSFSGLKTAAALVIAEIPDSVVTAGRIERGETGTAHDDICASLADVIARTLAVKLERALGREKGIRSLILAGGVAANSRVRAAMRSLAERAALPLALPSPVLCTDNGAMIAYTGYLLAGEGYKHDLSVSCIPRGTPVPDDLLYDASRAECNANG